MSGSSRRGVVITNGAGLHLRAAGRLVQLARQFRSEVRVFCDGRVADGASVLDLMMLGAACGALLEIEVSGSDAEEAAAAICRLVEARFRGSTDDRPRPLTGTGPVGGAATIPPGSA